MKVEKLSLKWHTYTDHLRELLHDMMTSNLLTDVTLVSEDRKQFKAHKVVLGACSSVFRSIISDNTMPGTFIYLRGIQSHEIESILRFIYLGEATFFQERMTEFLNVANSLDIKGINTNNSESELDTKEIIALNSDKKKFNDDIENPLTENLIDVATNDNNEIIDDKPDHAESIEVNEIIREYPKSYDAANNDLEKADKLLASFSDNNVSNLGDLETNQSESDNCSDKRRRRGKDLDWVPKIIFNSPREYQDSSILEELQINYTLNKKNDLKLGAVHTFDCKFKRKRRYLSCRHQYKITFPTNSSEVIVQEANSHEHILDPNFVDSPHNPSYMWTPQATEFIFASMKSRHPLQSTPRAIMRNLRNKGYFTDDEEPSKLQLYNKMNHLRKQFNMTDNTFRFSPRLKWYQ